MGNTNHLADAEREPPLSARTGSGWSCIRRPGVRSDRTGDLHGRIELTIRNPWDRGVYLVRGG